MIRTLLTATGLLVLAACSQVQVSDYAGMQPELRVEEFFTGPLSAHGVVKNRAGKVIRTFNATIDARWEDGIGTLDEDFVFNDGEQQKRIWTLRPQADGTYAGTAGDVTGEGVLRQAGNSIFLDYVLQVPYRDSVIEVTVDDRMYLLTPDILINESKLKKFGFQVGELLLVIKHGKASSALN
ncbi:DUF3833 family protein [Seongchinamella sediminis]|uniref:DUF3833 family protein n=1 Tax=Seongchinamella sediminis TaxID=2283635 RepID=A0A3L7DYP7_9GAMM|nr:DUF3833 domain-containing protein [Seongchinamella sediminis]RLQ22728.1 DUF3833 family protein [Seongchinamella sediminis]